MRAPRVSISCRCWWRPMELLRRLGMISAAGGPILLLVASKVSASAPGRENVFV